MGVYPTSSLVEQVTPTALEIADSSAIVSNITSPDHVLDLEDLAGLYPGVH